MSDKKQVIGLLEQVWFPEFDPAMKGVIAKIDTGADSGALHCRFERIAKDEKGKEVLEFQPLNKKLPIIQTKRFKRVIVRSSNGTLEERHRIETVIKVKDKIYPIKLSLTDRTDMKYDVIIGWQFLDDKFLVDVSRSNI
ncbi:MAG TPA: RimK/LysX family protein [Candidatus Saccharimonadales bacterium]|jgi:hypothetical protein